MERTDLEYVGFWPRVGASLIDTLLMGFIMWPLSSALLDSSHRINADAGNDPLDLLGQSMLPQSPADFLVSWVLPAVAVLLFWIYRQATPGKMAISAHIVDAETGRVPSKGQLIGRYLGYYVSTLPLCLGLLWVAFDPRKQGWHDKLAGTVVVRSKLRHPASVTFKD